MSALELVVLVLAGLAAGSINGAVGSGSLVTLPVLLALGLGPASAVTTNTIAMVLSAFGGVMAYRTELRAERPHLRPLTVVSTLGGLVGSVLLLTTPPGAIEVVVPVLIGFALLLVVFQPQVARWVRSRAAQGPATEDEGPAVESPYRSRALRASIAACSVYGGYFAAAQGVLLLGVLGAFTGQPMGRINGVKNLLTLTVNVTAAVMFTIASFTGHADVVWSATAAIAVGAAVGGYAGGRLAKAVPAWFLRAVIVVVAGLALVHSLA
ncbi:sulfite exporter TauE/SafE family protein [Cellulomonas alba]|uniref:Probable membrane transporter protein n=1 Tax=Cellulomonas alba TaxID=3053467 RepID=A0ABT7SKG2_9CELL|nr:sulfite exporter TauE/SafE family protein [Cellulomonas alba]MDM7856004.1 sulfite exporter TauE/SafE family protein [Cellulomonas alba]